MYSENHDVQTASRRKYVSRVRAGAAEQTRARILAAAEALLEAEPYQTFSLEAVALGAGVTRLTVYNQFGGLRGLLEALFDALAGRAGISRVGDAVTAHDPAAGVALLTSIFSGFWASSRRALRRLYGASVADPVLAQSLSERNERRRRLLARIVRPLAVQRRLSAGQTDDLVDTLFVLTSFPVFDQLCEGRDAEATRLLIQHLIRETIASAP